MIAEERGSGPAPPVDLRATLGAVVVPRDVVRVGGPEAVGYLHGQLSQDVEGLAVGATTWSFVLQPTGKVDAWVRLTRTADDELLLDVDGGFGDALVTRLRRFLLRTKAEIEPLDWTCVAWRGPGAEAAPAAAGTDTRADETPGAGGPSAPGGPAVASDPAGPADAATSGSGAHGPSAAHGSAAATDPAGSADAATSGAHGAGDAGRVYGGDVLTLPAGWPGVEGVDRLGPRVVVPTGSAAAASSNVAAADREAYEALRIRSGVPAMDAELTERTIPAEAGQWIVDASVDFTKGCFTGQELVARIDSRGGNVPRHLRGLVVAEGEPLPPDTVIDAAVTAGGKEVGRVTSAARSPAGGLVALAYVGRAVELPARAGIQVADATVSAAVLELPLD